VNCHICQIHILEPSVKSSSTFYCRYGYLTWEWHSGLRGYTYPAMFAVVYKLLGILHMDSRTLVVSVFCVSYLFDNNF